MVYISETEKELRELNSNKATTFGDISTKRCSDTLQKLFHDAIRERNFRDKLKCADVTPVFKSDGSTKAKNYRSVSVLSGVSKMFERQCPLTCVAIKGFSIQHPRLSLIEKWKKV